MWDCDIRSTQMVYRGLEDSSRWGRAHRADDTQEAEENYSDLTSFWDPDTGLVLSWEWSRSKSFTRGAVTATDMP